jgi:membrane protein implicated in regulation of membrane protease activity
MKFFLRTLLTSVLTLGLMNTASAYVGPGAGLSLLGALWGLLAAVFAALAFILLWPFRKMLKNRRAKETAASSQAAGSSEAAGTGTTAAGTPRS